MVAAFCLEVLCQHPVEFIHTTKMEISLTLLKYYFLLFLDYFYKKQRFNKS
jgi:hypothetical protein